MQARRIQRRMSPRRRRIHQMHKLQRVNLRKLNLSWKMKLRTTKRLKRKLKEKRKKQKRQKIARSRYISRSSIKIMNNLSGTRHILNY